MTLLAHATSNICHKGMKSISIKAYIHVCMHVLRRHNSNCIEFQWDWNEGSDCGEQCKIKKKKIVNLKTNVHVCTYIYVFLQIFLQFSWFFFKVDVCLKNIFRIDEIIIPYDSVYIFDSTCWSHISCIYSYTSTATTYATLNFLWKDFIYFRLYFSIAFL